MECNLQPITVCVQQLTNTPLNWASEQGQNGFWFPCGPSTLTFPEANVIDGRQKKLKDPDESIDETGNRKPVLQLHQLTSHMQRAG